MPKKIITLPNGLVDAMREQRALLFLGSGASLGAKTDDGKSMPNSKKLSEAIADRFLNSKFKNKDLMRVSELALSQAGSSVFYQWLRDYFLPFQPTKSHVQLADFRWRAIATTNYDLLVENGYRQNPKSLQKIVSRIKDDQPIETMLSKYSHPVEYLKLHGCIEYVHDPEALLVLTPNSYNDHEANRQDLYNRLVSLGKEYPIIFCGHSLDDLHIRRLVENSKSKNRPMYYLVSPDFEPEEVQMWAEKRVEAIKGTFSDLMDALDRSLPPLMRVPAQNIETVEFPYRKHFRVQERESDETAFAFSNEFTHLHASIPIDDVEASRFYAGYDQRWGNIVRNFDVHRRTSFQILEYIGESTQSITQLCVITGAAGYGKTIALKRAAWELAVSFGEFVIWLDDDSKIRPDVLREIYNLIGKKIHIFCDRASLNSNKIEEILALSKSQKIPVVIITAERTNEWSIYCQRLKKYGPEIFDIKKLSERESSDLLLKLNQHNCLGILEGESKEAQRQMIVERLDRQLLVALHEITRGKPFEEIVVDEFQKIIPEKAQTLYLDICSLHRFDVPVRAGVVSRISDISFLDFEHDLFEPLQELVFTTRNATTGDWEYTSRHPVVSEMVFNQICLSDLSRKDQILRVLDGLDTSYRSDDIALSKLIRGRNLAETFEDASLAREVYEVAIRRNPSKTYLKQHWAIFEYTHRQGDIELAEKTIQEALEHDPTNPSLLHTQHQVFRRKANTSKSDFAKHTLRSQSRATLDKIADQNNAYVLGGRARLWVDTVSDALDNVRRNPSETAEDELAEAIDRAELALHRAFNMYPSDPDFLDASARLKELLGDTAASTELLQRAWQKMPRGSGMAKRLAKRYLHAGKTELATRVLCEAIDRDPSDRSVNLLLANIQFSQTNDLDDISANKYLAQSFVHGDREYFSRYVASAVAFAKNDFTQAFVYADDINDRAPEDFQPKLGRLERWLLPFLSGRRGVIQSNFGSYVFIKMRDCPRDIFAPESDTKEEVWDSLKLQGECEFDIEYFRRGPVAINLRNFS